MTKLELGRLGVVLSPGEGDAFSDAVGELEELGYSTIWLAGPKLRDFEQIADVLRATRRVRVATGILSVDRFGSEAVAAAYADLEASYPGRFVVGLGGAHGPKPLRTLDAYLDRLDTVPPTVPATARILAALGPRMLELARDRAAGAYPFLVTPDYTAQARSLLGEDTALPVLQMVILEPDPERARQIARGPLSFMNKGPGYASNFRRMGFSEDEVTGLSDRLVDAVTAWGDVDAVASRIAEQLEAGADQVVLSVNAQSPDSVPVGQLRQLAEALIP